MHYIQLRRSAWFCANVFGMFKPAMMFLICSNLECILYGICHVLETPFIWIFNLSKALPVYRPQKPSLTIQGVSKSCQLSHFHMQFLFKTSSY